MIHRKICVITGTRAEYGILYWTIKELKNSQNIDLQIIATGTHLSPEFGLTYKEIEEDGFFINKKIEIVLSSDTPIGISKSMGLGLISFAEAFDDLKPDIILILGDRYEMLAAASAAMVSRIPIAHCHGGEATEGVIDEAIRHSITKMSHIHFAATNIYRDKIIQLGEQPQNVFNVGGLGVENTQRLSLLKREELENSINFKLGRYNILVTFHPVTLDAQSSGVQIEALLLALNEFPELNIIFTMPNSDTDSRIIISRINDFVSKNPSKRTLYSSLGKLRYLSALQFMDFVIGNSSSGLAEVPSFKIPTINIGDRQKGRLKSTSVIDCAPQFDSIKAAIKKAMSSEFKKLANSTINPYGDGMASKKIVDILSKINIEDILKKRFYDIKMDHNNSINNTTKEVII